KKLGVIITDSGLTPLRAGITGIALGYAGMKGLKDYRKEKDLFGRPFRFETVSVVDSLAAAAVLTMGEGNESIPLAVVSDAPVEFTDRMNRKERLIPIKEDIYLPFLGKLPKKKRLAPGGDKPR
ncbi:MAG: hypothetical protein JWN64_675, partial [Parcubacteria group bacterium]|nr:hypothetical protein [Parcubacteria group bacterium]